MAVNRLALALGLDIPFPEGEILIHQPRMSEIGLLGEANFFMALKLLNFSQEKSYLEDKNLSIKQTNFDILMSIMNDKKEEVRATAALCHILMTFLFPNHKIYFKPKVILIVSNENPEHYSVLNNENYLAFLSIVNPMLGFNILASPSENTYNINQSSLLSKRLEAKFAERQKKLNKLKKEDNNEETSLFSRYISILSVGLQKDMNSFQNYTPYQLFDEYDRFEAKTAYDLYISGKLAGATGMDETDYWMKDLYSDSNKK